MMRGMAGSAGIMIRSARKKQGMSLTKLAEMVEKSAPYISDIERGNRQGSYETIRRIADVLKLDADILWRAS